MPNLHNRTAFRSVAIDATMPILARVYCSLVLIELALKDRLAHPNLGHDIPAMLQRLAQNNSPHRAALNQYRSELTNKLGVLHTTRVDNSHGRVRSSTYPDLRYLRHRDDWTVDSSTNAELDALRMCVDKTRAFLKTNLGFSQPI